MMMGKSISVEWPEADAPARIAELAIRLTAVTLLDDAADLAALAPLLGNAAAFAFFAASRGDCFDEDAAADFACAIRDQALARHAAMTTAATAGWTLKRTSPAPRLEVTEGRRT